MKIETRCGLKIYLKPQLVTVVLKKIVKLQSMTVILRIFLKLLKPQSPMMVFYIKKKNYVDDYVGRKDYFDKYFGINYSHYFFFLQKDYFGLKLGNPSNTNMIIISSSTNYHINNKKY